MKRDFKYAAAFKIGLSALFALTGCDKKPKTPEDEPTVENLCLAGCPEFTSHPDYTVRVLKRSIYTLSNNARTKFADWVAYEVTKDTIGPSHPRNWHADPDLPADETLRPTDYKNIRNALHADRGHQAPLASLTGTADWQLADLLSNITPQATDLNEGAWEHLENAERKLATRDGVTVYSITGTLYERPMPPLPAAHLEHTVPSGYWKIVAVHDKNGTRIAAFEMDQDTPRDADYCGREVPVQDVERRAHLTVFPRLSATIRQKLETFPGTLMPALGCPG